MAGDGNVRFGKYALLEARLRRVTPCPLSVQLVEINYIFMRAVGYSCLLRVFSAVRFEQLLRLPAEVTEVVNNG